MAPCWKHALTRDSSGLVDAKGDLYGVPAQWGAMVIVYRPSEFQQFGLKPIQDWIDLLQPKLSRKVCSSAIPYWNACNGLIHLPNTYPGPHTRNAFLSSRWPAPPEALGHLGGQ